MSSLSRGLPLPGPAGRSGGGPHSWSESPRMQPGPLSYSSSPGMLALSPTSPTTHLIPPGVFSGGSSSNSSVFPNVLRTPGE